MKVTTKWVNGSVLASNPDAFESIAENGSGEKIVFSVGVDGKFHIRADTRLRITPVSSNYIEIEVLRLRSGSENGVQK